MAKTFGFWILLLMALLLRSGEMAYATSADITFGQEGAHTQLAAVTLTTDVPFDFIPGTAGADFTADADYLADFAPAIKRSGQSGLEFDLGSGDLTTIGLSIDADAIQSKKKGPPSLSASINQFFNLGPRKGLMLQAGLLGTFLVICGLLLKGENNR